MGIGLLILLLVPLILFFIVLLSFAIYYKVKGNHNNAKQTFKYAAIYFVSIVILGLFLSNNYIDNITILYLSGSIPFLVLVLFLWKKSRFS